MLNETRKKGFQSVKLVLAVVAAVGSLSLVVYQYRQTRSFGLNGSANQTRRVQRPPRLVETEDGRQLLWARGSHDIEKGEWFDITGSPLETNGYQFGIGKDTIPSIDRPAFVAIHEREKLRGYGISDQTEVIGYVHNGEAKAYPLQIMNRHELVNDMVGGKPVTVGW